MRYIDWLLNNYDTNADARWLVDHHDIWVMPTFNPDGHHIVESRRRTSPTCTARTATTRRATAPGRPVGQPYGVDDNRNFPFMWGCCGGSSGAPCEQTYRGVRGSEKETRRSSPRSAADPRPARPEQHHPAPITTTGV